MFSILYTANRIKKLKDKGNIKGLAKAVNSRNESVWTNALLYLVELNSYDVLKEVLSYIPYNKKSFLVEVLMHRISNHEEEYVDDIIDVIMITGDTGALKSFDIFINHIFCNNGNSGFDDYEFWMIKLIEIFSSAKHLDFLPELISRYGLTINEDARLLLILAIGKIGGDAALKFLREKLSTEEIIIKMSIVKTLGICGGSEDVEIIYDEMERHPNDTAYLKTCIDALIMIGSKNTENILKSVMYRCHDIDSIYKIIKFLISKGYADDEDIGCWINANSHYYYVEQTLKVIKDEKFVDILSPQLIKGTIFVCIKTHKMGNELFQLGIDVLKLKTRESIEAIIYIMSNQDSISDKLVYYNLLLEFRQEVLPVLSMTYDDLVNWNDRYIFIILAAGSNHSGRFFFLSKNSRDILVLIFRMIAQREDDRLYEFIDILAADVAQRQSFRKSIESCIKVIIKKFNRTDDVYVQKMILRVLYQFYKHYCFLDIQKQFSKLLVDKSPLYKYPLMGVALYKSQRSISLIKDFMIQMDSDYEAIYASAMALLRLDKVEGRNYLEKLIIEEGNDSIISNAINSLLFDKK